jgi:Family of unknown function (DUF5906)
MSKQYLCKISKHENMLNTLKRFDKQTKFDFDGIISQSKSSTINTAIAELIEAIDNTSNVRLRFNTSSPKGFELIEITSTCPIAGLDHPPGVKFGRILHDGEPTKTALSEYLQFELNPPVWKIVAPLVEAGGFNLKKPVCRAMISLAKTAEKGETNSEVGDHYSSLDYRVTPSAIESAEYLRSFLPPLSWFPQSLRDNVTADDLLSIVGLPTELEILRLHIGRTVAGCSGYIRGGETEVYTHTYRSHLLLYGRPATGKSTLLEYLKGALTALGLKCATLQEPSARFNQKEAYTATLAAFDDMTEKEFKYFFESSSLKTAATGGTLRVEEKGENALTIKSTAAIFGNTNQLYSKIMRSADPGNFARVNIVEVRTPSQLIEDAKQLPKDSTLYGVESLIIGATTSFLCQKFGVSIELLWAYLLRLCFDEFEQHEFIDRRINYLRPQLRHYINPEYRVCLFKAGLLALYLEYPDEEISNPSAETLNMLVNGAYSLFAMPHESGIKIKDLVKRDYLTQNKDNYHPWHVLLDIGGFGLCCIKERSNKNLANCVTTGNWLSVGEASEALFKGLYLSSNTMFEYAGDDVYRDLVNALNDKEEVLQLALSIRAELSDVIPHYLRAVNKEMVKILEVKKYWSDSNYDGKKLGTI